MGLKRITLIDLPHINVLQGYYLLRTLPDANIYLYGEAGDIRKADIAILPDWSFKDFRERTYALTLNQDSLPEIDEDIALRYLQQIRRSTTNYSLSVNQESQNTMMVGNKKQHIVSELVPTTGGYERLYRFPYWVREGYIEELYRIRR